MIPLCTNGEARRCRTPRPPDGARKLRVSRTPHPPPAPVPSAPGGRAGLRDEEEEEEEEEGGSGRAGPGTAASRNLPRAGAAGWSPGSAFPERAAFRQELGLSWEWAPFFFLFSFFVIWVVGFFGNK